MPAAVVKSVLAGKLSAKAKEAMVKHKDEPAKYDTGGQLPAGIENGVAKLTSCGFQLIAKGKQNEGKPIFLATGIIVSPETHNGIPIKGKRTSIIESVFDTPTKSRQTQEDHVLWIQNFFKRMGYDTSGFTGEDGELEAAAAVIEELGPHFDFRTWKGEKATSGPYKDQEPRTQETWGQAVEYTEGADQGAAAAVVDETGAVDDATETVEETVEEPSAVDPDLDSLALAGDKGKTQAIRDAAAKQIEAIAEAKGIDVTAAATWKDAVEMLKEAPAEEPAEEVVEEPAVPAVGEVWKYSMLDAKTKKKKLVEVEILTVDKSSKATLKVVNTGATLLGADKKAMKVPFDQLST